MAKVKNKKLKSCDTINSKKSQQKKTLNPFEIHVNKEKLRVLGKKSKNDRGLPGVSRAKAIDKRKRTLLKEYAVQHKSNVIVDRRIGERDHNMSLEEKKMARFTAEQLKAHKKKSKFNLADDEILTHRGQTLTEIEKFDDPRSDEEEDDGSFEKSGKLGRDFTGAAHFGGGVLTNKGVEGVKSHKDLIDKLISESKKRKAEKQKLKEATLDLTEKLDTEWKDLLPIISQKKNEEPKKPVDSYDRLMRELIFEARGKPSDRLKNEDEIAKEEKERLEKLEEERQLRMQGETKVENTKYRSADDLDDNFEYDTDPNIMISYNEDGLININGGIEQEDNSQDNEEQTTENDNEDSTEQNSEVDDDDEEEEEESDNLSDLKEESSESEEEDNNVLENILQNTEKLKAKVDSKSTPEVKQGNSDSECDENGDQNTDGSEEEEEESTVNNDNTNDIKENIQNGNVTNESAKHLPFTFALPESYESLKSLLDKENSECKAVIIERMVKCNHPSVGEGNKEKLGVLFIYLLQYLNDISTDLKEIDEVQSCFTTFYALVPKLYDLAHLNPEKTHSSIVEVLKEMHSEYRANHKNCPDLNFLLLFKLVGCLYTTSDFRNQVVTPCFVTIGQILKHIRLKSKREITYGLFLCTIALEYTVLSKRFLPQVFTFLQKVLYMSTPDAKDQPRYSSSLKRLKKLLILSSIEGCNVKDLKMKYTDLFDDVIDENFKIRCLILTSNLILEFSENLIGLPSSVEIFEPLLLSLERIILHQHPRVVKTSLENTIKSLESVRNGRKLEYLMFEKKKPKALRLYEPNIVKIFDYKKHKIQSREKAELAKISHKLKREKKGALREIRRDKAFLGSVQIKNKIQNDLDRKEKVKRIYADANIQQHELKKRKKS